MEVTKWLKPSDSVSRNTVTARVCRPYASERRANLEKDSGRPSISSARVLGRSAARDCADQAKAIAQADYDKAT